MKQLTNKIISLLLAAVLFAALLPGGTLPGFEAETALAASAGPSLKITKSNLKTEGDKTTAEIGIALDKNPGFNTYKLYIAVATYKPGGSELDSIYSKTETTSMFKQNYSYSYDISNHDIAAGGKTVLYVWDENGNPLSKSAIVTDGKTMTDGSIIFEAEDIYKSNTVSVIYTQPDSENTEVEKELSGGKGVRSENNNWTIDAVKGVVDNYEMRKEFIINDYKTTDVYTLWIRAKSEEPETGSIWLKTNSDSLDDLAVMSYSSHKDGKYRWSKKAITLKAGKNTIDFCTRTKGIADKFIITRDTTFTPEGIYDTPIYMTPAEQEAAWRALWGAPSITPPEDVHPRLLFTAEKLNELKAKWPASGGAKLYTSQLYDSLIGGTNSLSMTSTLGKYESAFDRSSSALANKPWTLGLAIIASRALRSQIYTGVSDDYINKTMEILRTYLDTVDFDPNEGDITRKIGDTVLTVAIVYDWMYDRISDDDKTYLREKIMELIAGKEIGWPPKNMSDVASHAGEQEIFRDLLAAGIAIYDEDPLLYDLAAGRMYNAMYESRNWLRQSGRFEQGSDYGEWRGVNELWAEILIRRMTNGEQGFLDKEKDYPGYQRALRSFIYNRLPYGSTLAIGDSYSNTLASDDQYYEGTSLIFQLGANLFNDPMLKHEFVRREHLSNQEYDVWSKLFALIFDEGVTAHERDHEVELDNAPLSVYSSYPVSGITARTSWQEGTDAPTALAFMDMHEVFVGDHQHKYTGDFQIYYKGLLAMTTGAYNENQRHNEAYNQRSISANTMLVEMPGEEFISGVGDYKIGNDGGQRQPLTSKYNVTKFSEFGVDADGKATNEELIVAKDVKNYIGPNANTPKVSYIKGNLAPAYNSEKVSDYNRSMIFIDRNDDTHPAAFIVYDRIKSTDASYKKTWLLHSEQEPSISGNKTVITRTDTPENSPTSFNGKLVNTTLLPSSASINAEGDGTLSGSGSMFNYVENYDTYHNYSITNKANAKEVGRYRIEISPSAASEDDTFLNAMFVTDADNNTELSMTKLSDSLFDGVLIGGEDTVLFNKGANLISGSFTITKQGDGFAFITGLTPGKWTVNNSTEFTVSADGESLYFEAPEGTYTISPSNGGSIEAPEPAPGIISYDSSPVYQDFMHVHNVGGLTTGYDTREINGETQYGYPRAEKPTSEYSSVANNQYVFALNRGITNGTLAYHDDDGDGKNDSIKATYASNYGSYDSFLKNNIQLVQTNRNLLNDRGIIEIKFTLKLTEGSSSRMSLLGLPGWRNGVNGSQANYFVTLSKNDHFFTPGGVKKSFESCGINPTEWNTYKLQYDIDNEMWHFWINEGEANEYYSYSPKATSQVPTDSNSVAYSNGSKGIFIGHYMYPDETGNGGFTAKDFHVSRLYKVPAVTEAKADDTAIPDTNLIKTASKKISFTLSDASRLTASDVSLKIGNTSIAGTISGNTVTFDTVGNLTQNADVKLYIKDNLMAQYTVSDALATSFGELDKTKIGDSFVWLQTGAGKGYFLNLPYPMDRCNPDGTGDKSYFPVDILKYLGCTVTKDMTNKKVTVSKGSATPVTLTGLIEMNGTLYTYATPFNDNLSNLSGYKIENQADRKIMKFLKN